MTFGRTKKRLEERSKTLNGINMRRNGNLVIEIDVRDIVQGGIVDRLSVRCTQEPVVQRRGGAAVDQ